MVHVSDNSGKPGLVYNVSTSEISYNDWSIGRCLLKAALFQAVNEPLVIADVILDRPQSHEVVVRTMASGVCHSDLHFMEGLYPMVTPAVLGHEAAGIIEEVGDQKIRCKSLCHARDQGGQRNRRCIGRNNRSGFPRRLNLCVKALLDVQAFDDRLDDPIAIGEQVQIVFAVSNRDKRGVAVVHESSGIGFGQPLKRVFGDFTSVIYLLRNNIQKYYGDPRVCQVRSDAGAHDAGTDHGGFVDCGHLKGLQHRRDTLSAADTLCGQRVPAAFPFKQGGRLPRNASPGCAKRMSEGDGAAI